MTEATLCFVIIIVDDLLIFKLTEASAFLVHAFLCFLTG